MTDTSYCTLYLAGEISVANIPTLWNALEPFVETAWGDEEPAQFILRGRADFSFGEVNYGDLPAAVADVLSVLGLPWAWHWGAGDGYPEGVTICDPDTSMNADFQMSEAEIVLTISEAQDAAQRSEAMAAQAFWERSGTLKIITGNTKGGENNSAVVD